MNATTTTPGKNSFRMDVGSNPTLKEYFSRKPDGHDCTFEVTFTKTGMTGDAVEGSVKSVTLSDEDYEEPAKGEEKPGGEVLPNAEEPVAVLMSAPTPTAGPPGPKGAPVQEGY